MEEIVTVNGKMYKLEYTVPLTPEQRAQVMNTISNENVVTLPNVPGATVTITPAGATSPIWTGITDSTGTAKSNGTLPSLPYGDYNISASLVGYTTGTATFNIPAIGTSPISVKITIINTQITITVTT